jgi:predicted acetyltransferase
VAKRPNGPTAWIPAQDVTLTSDPYAVTGDPSHRRALNSPPIAAMTAYRRGMGIEVRTVSDGEAERWWQAMRAGFLGHAADGEAEHRRTTWVMERTWAAFDGDEVVGTLRSYPDDLTVPGGMVTRAGCLTNVTVRPTHRRQGLLTRMITADLRDSKERGEAVDILIASEYPIYGRFGYGAASESATYVLDTSRARFRQSWPGRVELVDGATFRKEAPALYDRYRAGQPGALGRDEQWWDVVFRQQALPGLPVRQSFYALFRSESGEAEGYLTYTAKPKWDGMRPEGRIDVEELVAVTPAAYQRLWQYGCDVDLVTELQARERCVDESLPWMLVDARDLRLTERYDFLWVRPLDIPAALSARRYLADGSVVIDVVDDLGLASGRFLLDGGPDGAVCASTDRSADIRLPVEVLGSAYLGGFRLSHLAAAGRIDELRPGGVARADTMFRSVVTPWCCTDF